VCLRNIERRVLLSAKPPPSAKALFVKALFVKALFVANISNISP
jgi:hypothetical protein